MVLDKKNSFRAVGLAGLGLANAVGMHAPILVGRVLHRVADVGPRSVCPSRLDYENATDIWSAVMVGVGNAITDIEFWLGWFCWHRCLRG